MFSKVYGLLNKIIYKIKYGATVSFDGIPSFVSHMQIYTFNGEFRAGKNFSIKQGVYIAAVKNGKIAIGDNVSINRNCLLVCHNAISISDNCAIGPNTVFYDHDHNFGENGIESGYKTSPIIIERNCWIGAGCTILRGAHIGECSVIGAGTVIKGKIPPNSLVITKRKLEIIPL